MTVEGGLRVWLARAGLPAALLGGVVFLVVLGSFIAFHRTGDEFDDHYYYAINSPLRGHSPLDLVLVVSYAAVLSSLVATFLRGQASGWKLLLASSLAICVAVAVLVQVFEWQFHSPKLHLFDTLDPLDVRVRWALEHLAEWTYVFSQVLVSTVTIFLGSSVIFVVMAMRSAGSHSRWFKRSGLATGAAVVIAGILEAVIGFGKAITVICFVVLLLLHAWTLWSGIMTWRWARRSDIAAANG